MSTLSALCNKLEPTDELIMLQRHYSRLCDIDDKIEELRELIGNLDAPDLQCLNGEIKMIMKGRKRLDTDKAIQDLTLLSTAVSNEYMLTGMKSREIFTFQKLGKAISLYKSI